MSIDTAAERINDNEGKERGEGEVKTEKWTKKNDQKGDQRHKQDQGLKSNTEEKVS